jgi:putative inorganic carbon (HCO3(-)) transporter
VPSTSLAIDRYVIAASVVLTCALFTSQAADPVNVIKLTALMLSALALLASTAYRLIRYRVAQVPGVFVLWSTLLLLLGLVVSTAVAPVTTTAIVGTYGRNSGLLVYGSALVLFLASVRVLQPTHTRVLVGAVVAAGLFTSAYGLLQKAGIDPVAWNNPFNPIIAALGNPNFASGYLGIAASVAAGGALWPGWGSTWRGISGVTSVMCLIAAGLSDSVQGPIAAAAGLFVLAISLMLNMRSRLRLVALVTAGGAAAVSVAVLLVGAIAKAGPATAIFSDSGSQARVFYWNAALDMFSKEPLLGVGLDQYGNFWRTSRSPGSVEFLGGPSFSDAAHSVPLQVLAQGGLLLGTAYLALLALVGFALVRGLVRLRGADRILLGVVGGGWTAYQVQSFVSIDQVPLIVLHFTLAGAVLATSGTVRFRELRLPGAPPPPKPGPSDAKTRRRVAAAPAARTMQGADVAVLAGTAVLLLAAAWYSLIPLRANIALKNGDQQFARGDGNAALHEYQQATDLLPGVSVYWNKTGNLYDQVSRPALARQAYQAAVDHDPYDVNALRAAAAGAEAAGDLDVARRLFRRVVELDPLNPESLVAAATFELRHSGAEDARRLLEAAVTQLPTEAGLWATLGDARAVLGDTEHAREAYERALSLNPAQEVAQAGLIKLATVGA